MFVTTEGACSAAIDNQTEKIADLENDPQLVTPMRIGEIRNEINRVRMAIDDYRSDFAERVRDRCWRALKRLEVL